MPNRLLLAVPATVVLLLVTACGGDEPSPDASTPAAVGEAPDCEALAGVLADGTDTIRELVSDPTGATARLHELADELRTAGEEVGGSVTASATELAALYDDIASGMESGDMPDVADVTERTTALATACGA